MRLSTKTRYGVRAVFDLAYHCSGTSGQVKSIARRQKISPRYLEQIFHRLKKAGIVKSERGPKGGYTLTRDANAISIADIYRATEGELCIVPCDEHGSKCKNKGVCAASSVWEKLNDEIVRIFSSTTIEDLCKKAQEMNIPRAIENKYMYFI